MKWSKYQQAIFDDVKNGKGHTMVIARSGSGKTSTAIQSFRHLPAGKKTLMVAFNKAIADELRQRSPSYVDCSTMHSLGFKAIKKAFGNDVVVDKDKCNGIVEKQLKKVANDRNIYLPKNKYDIIQSIRQCISLCKAMLSDMPKDIESVIDDYDIETFDLEIKDYISIVIKSMGECKKNKEVIDFDDMIWFPFVYRLRLNTYDYVFVDETQDLNKAQMFMVFGSCVKGGRIIAIGDNFQAIYKFRGADSSAMDTFKNKLNAKELPLPITYRCAKKITYLAQKIVPDISPSPTAVEGEIIRISESNFLDEVKPGDFILSRTNAPLIKYCLALLNNNIPANIQGRDVGKNLIWFIKKTKKKTVKSLITYIKKWRKSEVDRVVSLGRSPQYYNDKAECLLTLCNSGVKTSDELIATIKKLFDDVDDTKKVVLSTTHKAKGLERDRVFILESTYRYSRVGPSAGSEEANLYYVAITRAKTKLYLVGNKASHSYNKSSFTSDTKGFNSMLNDIYEKHHSDNDYFDFD